MLLPCVQLTLSGFDLTFDELVSIHHQSVDIISTQASQFVGLGLHRDSVYEIMTALTNRGAIRSHTRTHILGTLYPRHTALLALLRYSLRTGANRLQTYEK